MGGAATLRVALGERSYEIAIGAGLLERAGELLAPLVPLRRTVVVTDENLARTAHPARLVAALERAGIASRTPGPARRREHQELARSSSSWSTSSWPSASSGARSSSPWAAA